MTLWWEGVVCAAPCGLRRPWRGKGHGEDDGYCVDVVLMTAHLTHGIITFFTFVVCAALFMPVGDGGAWSKEMVMKRVMTFGL